MNREEELTVSDDNLAYNIGLEIRYAIADSGVDPIQHIPEVDFIIKRRIDEIRALTEATEDMVPRSELDRLESLHRSEIAEMSERFRSVNVAEAMKQLAPALATEGGAHEKGLIAPRAGSFGVDWYEQWLKMRKNYNTLKHAAARVVAETDRIHDDEPWPIKYRAPYEAITALRAALTAKQTDGREGE